MQQRPRRKRPAPQERISAADYRALVAGGGKDAPRARRGFQIPPEHRLQIDVAEWLRLVLPESRLVELAVWWTSIDHAAARSALVGGIRKRRGVRAGIPDMLFLHRGRIIWIELKAETDTSDDQDAVQIAVEAAGAFWHVARSVAEVEAILRRHGLPLLASVSA